MPAGHDGMSTLHHNRMPGLLQAYLLLVPADP